MLWHLVKSTSFTFSEVKVGPKSSKKPTIKTKPKPTAKPKPSSPAVRAARKLKENTQKPSTTPPAKKGVCSITAVFVLILHEEIPYLRQIANAFLIDIVNKPAGAYIHFVQKILHI